MNPYITQLRQYLADNPLSFPASDAQDILDLLWDAYAEEINLDNELIRSKFTALSHIFQPLPEAQADQMFCQICALCWEYERLAFREGLKVGLHLYAAD